MDTKQLEDSVERLAEMLVEYDRIEELEERLQEAVKESLIQRFEYTEEMAWKTGKRYLKEVEGFPEEAGPKPIYRQLGRLQLLDADKWLDYYQARIDTSHDYSGEKADAVLGTLHEFHNDAAIYLKRLNERITERQADA